MKVADRVEFFDASKPLTRTPRPSWLLRLHLSVADCRDSSAQATDKGVNLATRQLFIDAPDATKMGALNVAGLVPYIKTIGPYPTKAKNVIATCKILCEQYGGDVPEDRAHQPCPASAANR